MEKLKARQPAEGKKNGRFVRAPAFICSAARYGDMPAPEGAEYCVIGRSNVGKSSFINHVLEKGGLARVSKRPGKTNLANFYRVGDGMVWVDMPGYGYAKVSRSEKIRWSNLIRDYCGKRENCYGIIWLLDIRHTGMSADAQAFSWFQELGLPLFPVITKSDKLSQRDRSTQVREICNFFRFVHAPVLYTIQKHGSRERFWEAFSGWRHAGALRGAVTP